jgi:ribonuclease D
MKPLHRFIDTPNELASFCQQLLNEPIIGVDTEFIRETTFFPRIALIQAATRDEVGLIDPTAFSNEQMAPFVEVLKRPEVLKVFHASHADQECLFWTYGLVAAPVLDTAVAAGLCGMGDSIGLQKLLREVLGIHVPKGRARAKWLNRPLSAELLHYAEQDVAHLVVLTSKLREILVEHERWEWALEESEADSSSFDVSPQEIATKLAKGAHLNKEEGVLAALVEWR